MKMNKISFKKDTSKRVTSPGADKKGYPGTKPKMSSIKKVNPPRTLLGKGNNLKPEGTLPKMSAIRTANSPRLNSFHKGY